MKYYIPIIGWLIAFFEYEKVYRAWKRGGPSQPTWDAFNNTMKGFIPTVVFLVLGILLSEIFS